MNCFRGAVCMVVKYHGGQLLSLSPDPILPAM